MAEHALVKRELTVHRRHLDAPDRAVLQQQRRRGLGLLVPLVDELLVERRFVVDVMEQRCELQRQVLEQMIGVGGRGADVDGELGVELRDRRVQDQLITPVYGLRSMMCTPTLALPSGAPSMTRACSSETRSSGASPVRLGGAGWALAAPCSPASPSTSSASSASSTSASSTSSAWAASTPAASGSASTSWTAVCSTAPTSFASSAAALEASASAAITRAALRMVFMTPLRYSLIVNEAFATAGGS
jgi:hypothetical protein